jgi:hypothetical protein
MVRIDGDKTAEGLSRLPDTYLPTLLGESNGNSTRTLYNVGDDEQMNVLSLKQYKSDYSK